MRAARLEAGHRARRRAPRRAAALAAWAAIVLTGAAVPASAQALYGRADVQFQRLETDRPGRTRLVTQSWLQKYELNHSLTVAPRTLLNSQFVYTQLSYVDRPDAVRSPYGRMRLQNPRFGFTASYKPVRTTSLFGDSALAEAITYSADESRFDGYVSAPRGPQVSGSWVRVHRREDVLSPAATGISRNLRAAQFVGPLNLRGGYTDRLRDPTPAGQPRTQQRAWDGGAGINLAGSRARMGLDYSYYGTERPLAERPSDRTHSHQASLQSGFAQSPRSDWTLNYFFRQSGLSDGRNASSTSNDGSLLFTNRPTRAATFTAGGGVRSVREISGYETQKYTSATLSARGNVRPGWTADAGISHTTNWLPGRATYGTAGAHAWSRMRARQGVDLTGNLQVGATSDSAVGQGQVTVQASYQVVFEPWRTFRFTFSDNHYNAGPRLFDNVSSSRSHTYDARWTPLPRLELRGIHSAVGTFPDASRRTTTTTWSMSYDPAPRLKLWSSYTRSSQASAGVSDELRGNEILSARVVAGLTPTMTVNAGLNVANPDTPTESRQFDVSVSKSFGRGL